MIEAWIRGLQNSSRSLVFAIALLLFLSGCSSEVETNASEDSSDQIEISAADPTMSVESEPVAVSTDEDADRNPIKQTEDPSEQVFAAIKQYAPRPSPAEWQSWPVIPLMTNTALEIYRAGLERGNNPHAFSKIGDCQNIPSMFLSVFDQPDAYNLGEDYMYLEEAIHWFSGSFERESESVRSGFNAASVVSPLWADPEACESGETPLDCEARTHTPSFGIISLETWWEGDPEAYEKYVREIIEKTIDYDIVPILTTKADNLEGDHRINATLAALAYEYDIPLWNFWLAVQPLPNHGLIDDEFHLTYAFNNFDSAQSMKAAWPWRNLTALQALDAIWREASGN
jgi:hypothetical protein